MDLTDVVTVFRRHPFITLLGMVLAVGAVLKVAYDFQPGEDGSGPTLVRQSYTDYTLKMQMMVIDDRYNVGRAGRPEDGTWDAYSTTILLAKTYSRLLTSGVIEDAAEEEVGKLRSEIEASEIEQSPIIELTLKGREPKRLRAEGRALCDALSAYLVSEQDEHRVAEEDRVSVTMLSTSAPPLAEESRDWEMVLVALLVPMLGAGSVGLLLDRTRGTRKKRGELPIE